MEPASAPIAHLPLLTAGARHTRAHFLGAPCSPGTVRACGRHLNAFVQRYLPCFYRDEQRAHADTVLRGKLTGLQRKTTEPIASQARQKRRPLQHFVGAGKWPDPAVRGELRRHVAGELADPDAALVVEFNRLLAQESEGKALDLAALTAGVAAGLADPRKSVYFVAEDDGLPLGQIMYTTEWSDWRNGWFWWIQSVYVRHEAAARCRSGVAQLLPRTRIQAKTWVDDSRSYVV